MKEISIKKLIAENNPNLLRKYPKFIQNSIIFVIEKLLKIKEINKFLKLAGEKKNVDFIDLLFDYLNVKINYDEDKLENIPSEDSVIIIANHPSGGLDGLALLNIIAKRRPDIKVVANDLLSNVDNLKDIFLPIDLYSNSPQKEKLSAIMQHIKSGKSVLFFPAAKVSRKINGEIRDLPWTLGAFKMARKFSSAILPIHIRAQNSKLFYLVLKLKDSFAPLLLPREMFGQKGKTIELSFGEVIDPKIFANVNLDDELCGMIRYYIYNIEKPDVNLKKIFQKLMAKKNNFIESLNPVCQKETSDIYVIKFDSGENNSKFLEYIGNIRAEVYSGIGAKFEKSDSDQDIFDKDATHILVWDRIQNELIGGYRLFPCWEFFDDKNTNTYLSHIFDFSDNFLLTHRNSIEIGRSFIQEKYQNKNYLDHLWIGIGYFLRQNPRAKYFYGTVSLGSEYSPESISLICTYYKKWYHREEENIQPHFQFDFPENIFPLNNLILSGKTSNEDFKILKNELKKMNLKIPVLLRKYVSLTQEGGTKFISISYDKRFGVVSLLCLVDLENISPLFQRRYLGS
jgi:putative hemolysin